MARTVSEPKYREIRDGFYWTQECLSLGTLSELERFDMSDWLDPAEEAHGCQNAYLFADERTLLFDTLTQPNGGEGPDTVLHTHSTLPHTENVPAFEAEWDEFETIAAMGRFPEIVGLPTARPRELNRPVDFAGRSITCIHPLLTDVTVSQWAYDHDSGVLFTAEAFGHYHDLGDCELTSTEIEGGIPAEHVRQFYLDKLPFIDLLDYDTLGDAFEMLFDILKV